MKKRGGAIAKTAHTVSALVFFIAALISFIVFLNLAISFMILQSEAGTGVDAGEQLGKGISAVVSVIFSIVFGVGEILLSLIGIPLAISVVKYRDGVAAIIAKIAMAINFLILAVTLVVFVMMFLV